MTKSTITREQLIEIIETDHVQCGEASYLARMAMAALGGEPVAWRWRWSDDAEGYWRYTEEQRETRGSVTAQPLYRHAQPAVDSDFIPKNLDKALGVLGMAIPESREEFNFQTERWIQRLIDRVIRYADEFQEQPAPVVPQDVLEALQKVARIRLDLNDFDGDRRGIADCLGDAEEALIEVVNRRAAMLQGAKNSESRCGIQTAPALDSFKENAEARCGNSPVIPEGYVMVPMRLTAENGAKGALSGEFSETKFVNCPECFGDDECETCDGSGRIEIKVPVSWTTIKDIWIKGVEHFAAAPQENK